MNKKRERILKALVLPALFTSSVILAGFSQASSFDQAQALGQSDSGFLEDSSQVENLNLNFVGGNTRVGVGFDTELKGRADVSHVFSETEKNVTSAQAWVGIHPGASDDEETLTGAGLKVNHHWVGLDESGHPAYVNKVFGAYDQNADSDKKVTVGYGQERENLFWSGHVSKGLSDERELGHTGDGLSIVEQAYDYGIGGRAGTFFSEHLLRVQGGLDYEWGSTDNNNEDTPAQLSVSGGVEKFFANSPHSVSANVEVLKKQGGYLRDGDEDADVRGNINYRYDFASEAGIFQPEERYRRVRVEIPGKTRTVVKRTVPRIERKLIKHTMELESDTFFAKGSYQLTPAAQQRLQSVIARIRQSGHEGNIRITGNTCDLGSDASNQILSEQRAGAVRQFMIANGFNPQELLARGLGESHPKYPNTDGQRHRNRRVDIEYVSYENKYQDQIIQQGTEQKEVRVISEPRVVWRKELIPTPPTWVARALRNNINHKQTIDTYLTVVNPSKQRDEVNQLPSAVDDLDLSTEVNVALLIDVLINDSDPDGDSLSIIRYDATTAQGGRVNLANGILTYTPPTDYTGADSFNYTISDGKGGEASARVSIVVSEAVNNTIPTPNVSNTAPQAGADPASTMQNTAVTIKVLDNDIDADGDSLSISQYQKTSKFGGSILISGSTLIYTPAADFVGTDTFTYIVKDGRGGESQGTVTVEVSASNTGNTQQLVLADDGLEAPVAGGEYAFYTNETTPRTLHVLENDVGEGMEIIKVTRPKPDHGTAVISEDKQFIIYYLRHGQCENHSFVYTVRDRYGNEAEATVYIKIIE
ncbi:MAG: hypothetical protein CR991_02460 [Proteobacteria bacterium]|nr:MAG: hypothetical protein CR991_02460 [Pseudomonadota bacterium]